MKGDQFLCNELLFLGHGPYNPGSAGSHYVDLSGLEFTEIHIPLSAVC